MPTAIPTGGMMRSFTRDKVRSGKSQEKVGQAVYGIWQQKSIMSTNLNHVLTFGTQSGNIFPENPTLNSAKMAIYPGKAIAYN